MLKAIDRYWKRNYLGIPSPCDLKKQFFLFLGNFLDFLELFSCSVDLSGNAKMPRFIYIAHIGLIAPMTQISQLTPRKVYGA